MAPSSKTAAAVASAWILSLVAVFFVGRATANDTVQPSPEPPIPPIDLGQAGTYVAIGDSYSAGEGLPVYDAGTGDLGEGDRCHRSSYAYPRLLPFVYTTTLVHRACSGAVVQNVFATIQSHDHTPDFQGHQIEPGSDTPDAPATLTDDVRLITITMGGNDLRFADMLVFCARHSVCTDDAFAGTGKTLTEWAADSLDHIQTSLSEMYSLLRSRAPEGARILVLGYPGLFPERVPSFFSDPVCNEVFRVWGQGERDAIREWNVELDQKIKAASIDSGVEYVDVYSFFVQHETCGSAGAWIKFVGDPSHVERDGWFHPTRAGQYMMARIVACYLQVFHSREEALQGDPTDAFAMSSCVADHYPVGGLTSLPSPSATPSP
jgi:lysophospholipase L1-like esterase